ncbi:MAG: M20 family metallopeptidase [Pirellula sp.]
MNALHQTLADLISIHSVNAFYDGGAGEAKLARYIERFFASRSIATQRHEVLPPNGNVEARDNVIAKIPGQTKDRRIILEAHMDTVSVKGMTIPPFVPTIQNKLMYGRGSCDTKAGLAAMMHAMSDLAERRSMPPCEVWLAAVVDEEFSFRGVAKLCEDVRADAAIVAEPTENRLVIASKGVLRWRMVSYGRSAHSSKSHLGINAIQHMARVVLALEQDDATLAANCHPLLGIASCNVGKIDGGVQVNFVPDQCAIEIDRRLLPNESVSDVLAHYERLLVEVGKVSPEFDVRMEPPMLADEAWAADPASRIVQTAKKALQALDMETIPCGVPFGSDASKLERSGVPTILFGPGSIDQAHTAVEYVDLDQVDRAFEFYRHVIEGFEIED